MLSMPEQSPPPPQQSTEGALYVTGLPTGCDEDKVKDIFGKYGPVKSVKVLPPNPQKNDVAAIVSMESPEQAKWIIDNISGTTPPGLTEPLEIKAKRQRTFDKGWGKGDGYGYMPPWMMMQWMQWGKGKGKGKGWGGGGGLSAFPAEKKVWVGGLPETVTYQELQAHFGGATKAKFATVMKGKGAGTGGIAFATPEEATEAIETLNGSILAGVSIVVDVWTKKSDTEPDPPVTSVSA